MAPVVASGHILVSVRATKPERGRGADTEAGSGDELDGAHAGHPHQVKHLPTLGDAARQTKVDGHHDQVPLLAAEQKPGRELFIRGSVEHVQVVGELPPDGEEVDGHERGSAFPRRRGRFHSSCASTKLRTRRRRAGWEGGGCCCRGPTKDSAGEQACQ